MNHQVASIRGLIENYSASIQIISDINCISQGMYRQKSPFMPIELLFNSVLRVVYARCVIAILADNYTCELLVLYMHLLS